MHRTRVTFFLKATLTGIFILILVVYSYTRSLNLIRGPKLVIYSPQSGSATTSPVVHISGNAQNITSITLNDRSIIIDENGNWSEAMLLSPGYNIFSAKVSDKFGRTSEKILELVRKSI